MTDVAPPEEPGWYADADGAWWWWDGRSWTAAAGAADDRSAERTPALLVWVLYLVGFGFVSSLVFLLTARHKAFVRHHAAESLNLTLVLLPLQAAGLVLFAPGYVDIVLAASDASRPDPQLGGAFWGGIALLGLSSVLNLAGAVAGLVGAARGRWSRLPLPLHPVRGVVRPGEEPDVVG